jgi:hypothetical protein
VVEAVESCLHTSVLASPSCLHTFLLVCVCCAPRGTHNVVLKTPEQMYYNCRNLRLRLCFTGSIIDSKGNLVLTRAYTLSTYHSCQPAVTCQYVVRFYDFRKEAVIHIKIMIVFLSCISELVLPHASFLCMPHRCRLPRFTVLLHARHSYTVVQHPRLVNLCKQL